METINIQRHEHEGKLQGFTMYFNNTENREVTLLLWDNELGVWYSRTAYRGSCSVGVTSQHTQATVFSSENHVQECDQFIAENNLVRFGDHYAKWHQQATMRVILRNNEVAKLLKQFPAFSAYTELAIPDGNYSYIYLGWLEPEHEYLLVNHFGAVIEPA